MALTSGCSQWTQRWGGIFANHQDSAALSNLTPQLSKQDLWKPLNFLKGLDSSRPCYFRNSRFLDRLLVSTDPSLPPKPFRVKPLGKYEPGNQGCWSLACSDFRSISIRWIQQTSTVGTHTPNSHCSCRRSRNVCLPHLHCSLGRCAPAHHSLCWAGRHRAWPK